MLLADLGLGVESDFDGIFSERLQYCQMKLAKNSQSRENKVPTIISKFINCHFLNLEMLFSTLDVHYPNNDK